MELVCLGEILIEMIAAEQGKHLHEVSAYVPTTGGLIAHVAIAARRLGMRSAFIGKVGDDAFGHHLHNVLRTEGVGTSGLRFDGNARTTLSLRTMPEDGLPEYIHYRNPGADLLLRPDELDEQLLSEARIFHFGSLSVMNDPGRSATQRAISLVDQSDSLISFGVNYQPSMWHDADEARTRIRTFLPFAHLVIVDHMDLQILCGTEDPVKGSDLILDYGPIVCIAIGADGSAIARTENSIQQAGSLPEGIVDTSGSRAAFTAGFLWRILGENDWRKSLQDDRLQSCLRFGSAAFLLTANHQGILETLPDAPSLADFVQRNYSST